jgi:hypothetical protein
MIRCEKNHAFKLKHTHGFNKCHENWKTRLKWCWKRYGHAIFLICSCRGIHSSIQNLLKRGCKLGLWGEKLCLISSLSVFGIKVSQTTYLYKLQ